MSAAAVNVNAGQLASQQTLGRESIPKKHSLGSLLRQCAKFLDSRAPYLYPSCSSASKFCSSI